MVVRGYTPDEVKAVMQSMAFRRHEPKLYRCILALQVSIGARIHEVLSLKCGDVFERGIVLKRKIWLKKTKTGRRRLVVIPDYAAPYLLAWAHELAARGLLLFGRLFFVRANGSAVSRFSVYRAYKAANDELGLTHCGTHSARKAWAAAQFRYWSDERRRGKDIDPLAMVAKIGGWETLDACARYIGLDDFDPAPAQEHIGRVFFGSAPAQKS